MGHGEYKTHGGKLVQVDLRIEDGVLRDVRVTGDFFLEPPDTLDDLRAGLEGAPADADPDVLESRVLDMLRADAVLIGVSTAAVVEAARRAVADAGNTP